MADRRIAGRVLHRGTPQADCQVLAVDEAASGVLADAETGPDGAWELDVPAAGDVLVFARCRGQALGVVARSAGADSDAIDLEIEAVAPTHELTVRLEGEAMPEWVRPQVLLMPVQVGKLDQRLLRWVNAPVRGMSSGALARITPEHRELERFVQTGTWWLAARFELVPDARAEGMEDAVRWHGIRARTADGRELSPLKRGFALEIHGPAEVTITLGPDGA
jgi:hypothetical protein